MTEGLKIHSSDAGKKKKTTLKGVICKVTLEEENLIQSTQGCVSV